MHEEVFWKNDEKWKYETDFFVPVSFISGQPNLRVTTPANFTRSTPDVLYIRTSVVISNQIAAFWYVTIYSVQ